MCKPTAHCLDANEPLLQISINTWVAPTFRLDLPKELAEEVVQTMKPILEEWTGACACMQSVDGMHIIYRRVCLSISGKEQIFRLIHMAVRNNRRHQGAGADGHQRHPHLPPRGHHPGK